MLDTDYNEESFFVRQRLLLGANDPYGALKVTSKAEIDEEAWESLHSDTSRPFPKPASGRIAVKVTNHVGDEAMRVFAVVPRRPTRRSCATASRTRPPRSFSPPRPWRISARTSLSRSL